MARSPKSGKATKPRGEQRTKQSAASATKKKSGTPAKARQRQQQLELYPLVIAVVSDDVIQLADGPTHQWITKVIAGCAPQIRGPIEQQMTGLYTLTSSYFDMPHYKARLVLAGLDGLWITAGRDELEPVFGNANTVLMLGDQAAQYDGRIEYLLDGANVVRVVAHRNEPPPGGTHDILVHADWTTQEGAMEVMMRTLLQTLKRVAGRA